MQLTVADIDGMDLYVAKALLEAGLRPSVFCVEYNASFGPDAAITIPYDADFNLMGEAFLFDSDHEPELAQPWYRETRTVQIPVEFRMSDLGPVATSVLRTGRFNYRVTGDVQVRAAGSRSTMRSTTWRAGCATASARATSSA